MEQSGEYLISADRETVWRSLNDAEVLQQCIAGCQTMDKVSDEQFDTKVKAKVGPVSATFNASLLLSEINAPDSYTITANVKGGAAGFGKGAAKVSLADGAAPETTQLRYSVDASVGGKLAQIGSRLLDGAARKMADDFFAAFGDLVGGSPAQKVAAVAETATPESVSEPANSTAAETETETETELAPVARQQDSHWWLWGLVFGGLALALVLAL